MILASLETVIIAAPIAFIAGCGVGFVCSNRWKIIRRNGG